MRLIPLVWVLVLSVSTGVKAQKFVHEQVLKLMGTRFELTAVSDDEALSRLGVQAGIQEISRIEDLISSWDPRSQTSEINKNAGIRAVRVDMELFQLIHRSLKVSTLTDGAFDISFASIGALWTFEGQEQELPPSGQVKESVENVGYQKIILNHRDTSVFLSEEGMKIGFGGIGKGYAANRAMQKMKGLGITGGVVNASGDLIGWGQNKHGEDWDIGIADPKQRDQIFSWLAVKDMAVVTSGDYEQFFTVKGKRYAHIVDPRTGYPTTGIKSVTIVCPDAELADALATSIFVMGEKKGLELINGLKNIECLIVNDHDEITTSDNLQLNYYDTDNDQEIHN